MRHFTFSIIAGLLFFSTLVNAQNEFIIGQDLSYVNQMEDCGAVFREDGQIKDVYQIFADNGTNLIRVRLWHNPSWQEILQQPEGVKAQYSNFEDVKETIFRAKMAGMKVMLGFHFSDFWCDPGRQILPEAWEPVANNENALADSVYNYVFKVLNKLQKDDLLPEYIKIGNENNSGIMTHKGMNNHFEGEQVLSWDWARHGRLYNSAIKAVRAVGALAETQPKIALHVADHNRANWFYNNIINNQVIDFDVMGFTYYYSYHGGSPSEVGQVIEQLIQEHPQYEAMVVETGYLWDTANIDQLGNIINKSHPQYQPVSPETQKEFMLDLTHEVEDAGGTGVIFWESAWVSTPCTTPWGKGSSQEHVAFFDHRNQLNYMKDGGGGWPNDFWNNEVPSTTMVTFKVDMTDQDDSRGVYMVGTTTNWNFIEMQPESNNENIFQIDIELNIGEAHAYYFITSDNWTNYEDYRETVPEDCALSDEVLNDPDWTTDRGFIVPDQDTTLAHVWSSCENFTTGANFEKHSPLKIYPNPSKNGEQFFIQSNHGFNDFWIEIFNIKNQKMRPEIKQVNNQKLSIDGLKKGLYFIQIKTTMQCFTQKVLVLN